MSDAALASDAQFAVRWETERAIGALPEVTLSAAGLMLAKQSALRVLPIIVNAAELPEGSARLPRSLLRCCRSVLASRSSSGAAINRAAVEANLAASELAALATVAADAAVDANSVEAQSVSDALFAAADGARAVADFALAASHLIEYPTETDSRDLIFLVSRIADSRPGHVLWSELARDVARLTSGETPASLLRRPLWVTPPEWALDARDRFRAAMQELGGDWPVWAHWYDLVFEGRPEREAFEARLDEALNGLDDFWTRDPDEVTRDIARLAGWPDGLPAAEASATEAVEPALATPPPPAPHPASQPAPPPASFDVFLSYAKEDAELARFVASVIEEAGLTVFAQFSHIPTGSNFVERMNHGLQHSRRLVALLSPAYVASGHCLAECGHAYQADPAGRAQRLTPFLVRPAALPPLLEAIVHTPLIGLSGARMREAILAALAPPRRPTPSQALARAAASASPLPRLADGRLDAAPNPDFDAPDLAPGFRDLITTQIEIGGTIFEALPGNAPPSVRAALPRYCRHLEARGARASPRSLTQWGASLILEFRAGDADLWGAGVASLLDSFAGNHAELLGHFSANEARERDYAEATVNEQAASGRALDAPINAVVESAAAIADAGLTTPAFDEAIDEIKAQAEMLAPVPPCPAPTAGPDALMRASTRKRFVLSTLGFLTRTATVLSAGGVGAAAFLASPQGAVFAQSVARAIEMLKGFLTP